MTNNSATGGYLQPNPSPGPIEDAALADFLQAIIVGLTGLNPKLVFPRWQVTPPNIPSIAQNWASIGIQNRSADTFAYEIHNPAANSGDGVDVLFRNEQLDILCSFYGPGADNAAALTRDGLSISQNREVLLLNGMALIGCDDIVTVPSLVNNQWFYRVDMMIHVRRSIVRTYQILHLLTAGIVLETDNTPQIIENINVSQ